MDIKSRITLTTVAMATGMLAVMAASLYGDSSLVIGTALVGAVLTVLFGVALAKSTLHPLQKAAATAQAIASGDHAAQFNNDGHDEISKLLRLLNQVNASYVSEKSRLLNEISRINLGVSGIVQGNLDLSERSGSQASALEDTASSMEHLASGVRQNADSAHQANKLVISASGVASKGGEVISEVMEKMQAINDSAKKISDIIGVIDGIAFQTNILALNAAVEAARAGEQGKGFAVVATEVRSLAHRSASAAKEIKDLIADSVGRVEAGVSLVNQAGRTMTEIVESVSGITHIMSEISAAASEQSAGIDRVNQAVAEMGEVTRGNALLVERAVAAAQSLQGDAHKTALVRHEAARQVNMQSIPSTSVVRPLESGFKAKPIKPAIAPQCAAALKSTSVAVAVASVDALKPLKSLPTASINKKAISTDISGDDWEEF
jgi:methyl-accepting chemotaxis protein